MSNWEKRLKNLADPDDEKRRQAEARSQELEEEKEAFFDYKVSPAFKHLREKLSSSGFDAPRPVLPQLPLNVRLQDGAEFSYQIEVKREKDKLVPYRTIKVTARRGKALIDEEDSLAPELHEVSDQLICDDYVEQFEKIQERLGARQTHGRK